MAKKQATMDKEELVSMIARRTRVSKRIVALVLNGFMAEVLREVADNHGRVAMGGFGHFDAKPFKARKGRNPQTNEEITIPARMVPVFEPSRKFRERTRHN